MNDFQSFFGAHCGILDGEIGVGCHNECRGVSGEFAIIRAYISVGLVFASFNPPLYGLCAGAQERSFGDINLEVLGEFGISASKALAEAPSNDNRPWAARSDASGLSLTTLYNRAHGRPSIEAKAQSQQYLTVDEEKVPVAFLLLMSSFGQPVRIKYEAVFK